MYNIQILLKLVRFLSTHIIDCYIDLRTSTKKGHVGYVLLVVVIQGAVA
jgi:hypothetical protein